jgi:hypothetical protein
LSDEPSLLLPATPPIAPPLGLLASALIFSYQKKVLFFNKTYQSGIKTNKFELKFFLIFYLNWHIFFILLASIYEKRNK